MASGNEGDRMLALFAFKKLNLAHSIDFVDSGDELLHYLQNKLDFQCLLPDLMLLDLNLPGKELSCALQRIKENTDLQNISTILFSISDLHKGYYVENALSNSRYLSDSYNQKELVWVFEEICEELVAKQGWRYAIQTPLVATLKESNSADRWLSDAV